MRIILCFFFVLLLNQLSFAQGVCDLSGSAIEKGNFDFSGAASACIGNPIQLIDKSGGKDIKYIYGYQGEDASKLGSIPSSSTPEYSFLSKGVFTILQYGTKNGKPMYFCRKVSIIESLEPIFSASACNEYMQVVIGNEDTNKFDYYSIDWGDGNIEKTGINETLPITKAHNYLSTNPTQTIKVEGHFNNPINCPKAGFKTVTMNGGSDYPTIKSLELAEDKKSVKLNFTGAVDTYDIYQRSASKNYNPSQIFKQLKPGTYQLDLVDTTQSCFRVFRNFGCKEGSGEVCTIKLNGKNTFKQNQLNWRNHPANNQNIIYDLQIVNTQVKTSLLKQEINQKITPIASPNNPFIDDIDCKKQYCYQIESIISGTIDYGRHQYSSTSLSNKICIDREKIAASPLKDVLVSVNPKAGIDIVFKDDSPWTLKREKYFLYRDTGKAFVVIDSVAAPTTSFEDKTALVADKSECYTVRFRDECGSLSEPSPMACSVYLLQNAVDDLLWTAALPFSLGGLSRYEIIALNETTLAEESITPKSPYENTHQADISKYEAYAPFRIKAVSYTGKESYSNIFKIPIPLQLLLPSAFSPNGDGINDLLMLYGKTKRIQSFQIYIYNRWGNLVFSDTNPTFKWDGTFQGIPLAAEVYSFRWNATLDDGSTHAQSGELRLLR